jgi:hypothetical protein
MSKTGYQAQKTTGYQLQELVDKFFADDNEALKRIKEKLQSAKEKYGLPPPHVTTRLVDRKDPWSSPSWQDQLRKIERNGERKRHRLHRLYRVESTTL